MTTDDKNGHGLSLTAYTSCCKTNSQSNEKGQISIPWGSETSERISIKLGMSGNMSGHGMCSPRPLMLSHVINHTHDIKLYT